MRNLQVVAAVITALISMQSRVARATEMAPFAECKSISESGYELTFTKLTSRQAHGDPICVRGSALFQVYRFFRIEKLLLTAKAPWDRCSKNGTQSHVETETGYSMDFVDGPFGMNGASVTEPSGTTIEFQCEITGN